MSASRDRTFPVPEGDDIERGIVQLLQHQMQRTPVGNLQCFVENYAEAVLDGFREPHHAPVEQVHGLQRAMHFRDLDATMDEVGNIKSCMMHDRPDTLQSPEETLRFTIAKAQEINHRYAVPAAIELDQTNIRG